jgi:uncharacterized protein YeaO (DUF488 family)
MADADATGSLSETYQAAIQHDLVALPAEATLVGVVRRPTAWFSGSVEENRPALAPPDALLDETKAAQADLARQGLCEEEAHNAAWRQTDFEERYLDHLESSADAEAAMTDLLDRVADGVDIVLVCYEADDKRCHRHLLLSALRDRAPAAERRG